MTRTFEDRPAAREATPIMLGLVGPSSSGKTFSALRLATGIQRVTGGDIYGIDTESRRMLHYADKFKFRHLPFGAPFGSADYLAAIRHCVSKGAKIIVIDSTSHEHEGPGGILEQHEAEVKKLLGKGFKSEFAAAIPAWAAPKAARRQLINAILQIDANFIFCFRAKEKLKIQKGKDPEELGFMAIGGEEWIYEMQMACLLLPNSNGYPTWKSDYPGEKLTIKLPGQFREMFTNATQLSEDVGQRIAEWTKGAPSARAATTPTELLTRYAACSDPASLRALEDERGAIWKGVTDKDVKAKLKAAADAAAARIAEASRPADPEPGPDDEPPPDAGGEQLVGGDGKPL